MRSHRQPVRAGPTFAAAANETVNDKSSARSRSCPSARSQSRIPARGHHPASGAVPEGASEGPYRGLAGLPSGRRPVAMTYTYGLWDPPRQPRHAQVFRSASEVRLGKYGVELRTALGGKSGADVSGRSGQRDGPASDRTRTGFSRLGTAHCSALGCCCGSLWVGEPAGHGTTRPARPIEALTAGEPSVSRIPAAGLRGCPGRKDPPLQSPRRGSDRFRMDVRCRAWAE